MTNTVISTKFTDLKLLHRGKVRDMYDLGDTLLMVASDRISAFDVIMDDPINSKGEILTSMSLLWFDLLRDIIPNHLITADVAEYPARCQPYADILRRRSMLVKKAKPLPVECIVRGYISGSLWQAYQQNTEVCGYQLPAGLRESEKLPEVIFTPSTKAELGAHDENISVAQMRDIVGGPETDKIIDVCVRLYETAAAYARQRGIIIADTKFELGWYEGELILIDEVLTPDSSRFWPEDLYETGRGQASFDKQFLRDYLQSLDWPKTPPPPKLPADIIEKTRFRYQEALNRLQK
ncbi:MAG: phosphoribosylaminoimidazolesuccinocarboxamide synthase [Deltaproteobacteria bacterium]|nr:phosphoribosylaminoimidazolesuccinocarboxamide synthase [Deltaproteobacteria bacterium]